MVSLSVLALQVAFASTQAPVVDAPSEIIQHGIHYYQAIKPAPPAPLIPVRGGRNADKYIRHPSHNARSLFLVESEETPAFIATMKRNCTSAVDCMGVLLDDLAALQRTVAMDEEAALTTQSSSTKDAPALSQNSIQCESYAECVEKFLLRILLEVTNEEYQVTVNNQQPTVDEQDGKVSKSHSYKQIKHEIESVWLKATHSLSRSLERVASPTKALIKRALDKSPFKQGQQDDSAGLDAEDSPSLTRNPESDERSKIDSSVVDRSGVDPLPSDPRDLVPSTATKKFTKPLGVTPTMMTPSETPTTDSYGPSLWPRTIEVEVIDPIYAAEMAAIAAAEAAAKEQIEFERIHRAFGFFIIAAMVIAFAVYAITCVGYPKVQFLGFWAFGFVMAFGTLYNTPGSWLITSPYQPSMICFHPQVAAFLLCGVLGTLFAEFEGKVPSFGWMTGNVMSSATVYVGCTVSLYLNDAMVWWQHGIVAVGVLGWVVKMGQEWARIQARRNA
ncbi:hypothetical protein MPSEU_000527500 [Mayamaea pseudoterrestris]|nr:hypothetical protein MPSEU_000527500 [Mayamaea pseudoterrestris]